MAPIKINKYRSLLIGLLFISASVMAQWTTPYTQSGTVTPVASMQSIGSGYMVSGSAYSSEVYEIGSGSPSAAHGRTIMRDGFPGVDDGTYNPNNPNFGPVGDALIPLLLLALIYAIVAYRRKLIKG